MQKAVKLGSQSFCRTGGQEIFKRVLKGCVWEFWIVVQFVSLLSRSPKLSSLYQMGRHLFKVNFSLSNNNQLKGRIAVTPVKAIVVVQYAGS